MTNTNKIEAHLNDLKLTRGHSYFQNLIERGGLVIDAGAHRCEFANQVASHFGVKVIAIEPNRTLCPSKSNPSVTLKVCALADFDGKVQFQLDDNPEASSIYAAADTADQRTIDVSTVSLTTLIKPFERDWIELLKLDIEGAEYDVLMNTSAKTLEKIKQISVEFHPFNARLTKDLEKINLVRRRLDEAGFGYIKCSFRGYGDILFYNKRIATVSSVESRIIPFYRKLISLFLKK